MTTKFRKKPVVIEANQWDGSPGNALSIQEWAKDSVNIEYHSALMDGPYMAHPDPYLLIPTLEGTMSASVGDYIIKGINGEF